MTYQDLSNFIWTIADDVLRGLFTNYEWRRDHAIPRAAAIEWILEPH